jgi:hypothetical protein
MRIRALFLCFVLLPFLPASARAHIPYDRPINIISSNYDLNDTTYIDRGRLDGAKVGDIYEVKFRDGKLATKVVVTGVFERMASVKIVDNWLLKSGQLAYFKQRPMVVALERESRRPAPDIHISTRSHAGTSKNAPKPQPSAPTPPISGAAAPVGGESALPPAAPGAVPAGGSPSARGS